MPRQVNDKLLTIITVSYNSQETIRETLESIGRQLDLNFEYIIIDGGSSDSTLSIIEEYDFVDVTVSEPDRGIYDGMNRGIARANGRFIGFLNSDDLFASNDVTLEIKKKIEATDAEIIYGNIKYFEKSVNEVTRTWRSGEYKEGSFNKGWHPPHPAFYASRELFTRSGDFDLDLKIAADFELMLRFFNCTKKDPVYLDKDFVLMREGGASHANRIQGNKDVLNAFKKNDIEVNQFTYLWRRLASKFIRRYLLYPLLNIFGKI